MRHYSGVSTTQSKRRVIKLRHIFQERALLGHLGQVHRLETRDGFSMQLERVRVILRVGPQFELIEVFERMLPLEEKTPKFFISQVRR